MPPIARRSTRAARVIATRHTPLAAFAIALAAGAVLGACATRLNAGLNVYCDDEYPCLDKDTKCDMTRRLCVSAIVIPMIECDETHPCGASMPICDLVKKKCGPCAGDDACAALDPAKPRCLSGRCVQCSPSNKIDCAKNPATAICDAAGFCRGCRSNAECADGLCYDDGKCATTDDFVYVNADACMNNPPDGSAKAPFCEVVDALPKIGMNGKRVVKIEGAAFAYVKPVVISIPEVILKGPGRKANMTARFQVLGTSAIRVEPNSKVVIDGLTISGAGDDGITCASNSRLIVRDSKLDGNHQAGINAGSCEVTIDASWFETNRYGALRFGPSSKYVATNNFIINNGVNSPAVTIEPTASGSFAFNTLINNYGPNFGGIDCGMGATPKRIERSIVWNNGSRPGPTQFYGECELVDVITGDDIAMGAIKEKPGVNETTGQLTAPPNPAIDRIKPGAGAPLPDHDGEGNPRPSGAGWDVGAHEYKQPM